MSIFSTSWRTSVVLLALGASASTGAAQADEDSRLEARGEATLGGSLHFIDGPYDNDFLGGFWDQYRHTRKKNDDPAYFIDLLHFDLGLAHEGSDPTTPSSLTP